jgi:hypothetical protein
MEARFPHRLRAGIRSPSVKDLGSALLGWICLLGFVVAIGVFLGSLGGAGLAAAKHQHHVVGRLLGFAALAALVAVVLEVSGNMLGLARVRRRTAEEGPTVVPPTLFVGTMAGLFAATPSGWAWVAAGRGLPPGATIHSLALGSIDRSTIYARTDHGVFGSTDRGSTWRPWINGAVPGDVPWVNVAHDDLGP